ncbi:hypothetical protein I3760_09G212300 [Carya illinoinensis]|nr:hypothetical protein I3760_09G212300 [Carya illinoinensis]
MRILFLISCLSLIPLCSLFLKVCTLVVSGQCLGDEQSWLLQLTNKLMFNGALSAKLAHWNDSADCCSWEGKLNLAYNEFDSSQIPSQFTKLSNLTYLNLSTAGFAGQILLWISHFKRLATLDLSILSHRITYLLMLENPNLSTLAQNLSGLRELHLDGVNILAEGYEWCQALSSSLPHLRVLRISRCYLSRPFDPSLQNLQSLSVIHLAHNYCPTVNMLDLRSNHFHGQFPFFLPSVVYLDLSKNNFNSSIQKSIENLPNTTNFFSLSSNKFNGIIPVSICNATYFQVLGSSNNSFNGIIPRCLIEMTLNENQLGGELPKSLANCTKLKVLHIGNNHIEDTFPCYLKNSSSLRVLILQSNKFYRSIGCPGPKATWLDLQILDLAFNKFSGKLSKNTLTVVNKDLELELVKILTISTYIDFSCNNLVGPIPEELGVLKLLYVLNLSNNVFTGQIPSSLGKPVCLPPTFGETPSDSRIVINWNYLSIELGYVFGFGIFIGPLVFWERWRIWYFKQVDSFLFKIFLKLYLGRKIQHRPTQRNRGQRRRESIH